MQSSPSHKFTPHTHSQGLTWQECQAKKKAPHLGASLSTSKIHPSKHKWMKPNGQGAAADAGYRDIGYVAAIWFILHVLQLLPITLTQQNLSCISKSMMKQMQKPG